MGHGLLQRRDPIRRKSLQDGTIIAPAVFGLQENRERKWLLGGVNPRINYNTAALKS